MRVSWSKLVGRALTLIGVTGAGLTVALHSCVAAVPPRLPTMGQQPGWTVSSAAPVITAGSMRAKALWNDPSVLRTSTGYVMYMTTSTGEPFAPPILPFRAVSTDGKTWTLQPSVPLLKAAAPYVSIETPSVVQFRGRWHMFFTGIFAHPDPSPMAIGHAVSDDGVAWKIDQPLLLRATGRATDWNSYLVGEPGAVVVGDTLKVYFSAVGARADRGPPQSQSIGVVTSSDGFTFSPQQRVLVQTAQFPGEQGFAGYSSPAAIMMGQDLHLFYSVAYFQKGANPEWRQVAIAEAVSAGGKGPFREAPSPVVTVDSTKWSEGEVIGPAPLIDRDRLLLWFGGHVPVDRLGPLINRGFAGPEFGIGLASRGLVPGDRDAAPKGGS